MAKLPSSKPLYLKIGNSRLTYWRGEGLAASVVPKLSKKISGIRFVKAGDVPLKLPYKSGIGIDRVLNVFSATRLYPRESFLVVDFGTALTFEFFHSKKGYLGGWISPGAEMMSKALRDQTALLPHIKIVPATKTHRGGENTKDSIQLGIQNTLRGSVAAAVEAAAKILGSRNFRLIVTGGGAKVHLKELRKLRRLDHEPLLLLRGLKILHHDKLD